MKNEKQQIHRPLDYLDFDYVADDVFHQSNNVNREIPNFKFVAAIIISLFLIGISLWIAFPKIMAALTGCGIALFGAAKYMKNRN